MSGGCIRWDAGDLQAAAGAATGGLAGHGAGSSHMGHMGCVVENSVLQAALLAATQRQPGGGDATSTTTTRLMWPASVVGLGLPGHGSPPPPPLPGPSGATSGAAGTEPPPSSSSSSPPSGLAWLQLEDGRRLSARLVVAADGGASRVRALAGLRTLGHDYHQRGLVATVRTSGGAEGAGWGGRGWQRGRGGRDQEEGTLGRLVATLRTSGGSEEVGCRG